jgi:hypothetical protein
MTVEDAGWAAGLMAERRAEYERYAPVFWKPAADAVERHRSWLGRVLADPATVAVRDELGFAIATPFGDLAYVDDMAVADGDWAGRGAALLRAVWAEAGDRGAPGLRVVTARLDGPKVAMLEDLGLEVRERWWFRPHPTTGPPADPPAPLVGDGFEVRPFPPPPVYAVGGMVGIATRLDDTDAVDRAAAAAAGAGLVSLIAPRSAGDVLEPALAERGFDAPSAFYVGSPAGA